MTVGIALLAGCAGTGEPVTRPSSPGNEASPRLLVVLPTAPPSYLDRITGELAGAYSLKVEAAWQMESLDQRCIVFSHQSKRPLKSVVRSLAGDPRVDVVEPVHQYETQGNSAADREPYRHLQHAADTLALDPAHTLATGKEVRVAVIDTGADLQHPELDGRVSIARDFVRRGDGFTADRHGTAVAGLIAASADNGFGILGVAPQVELMLLKACWPHETNPAKASCDSYTLALALDFAIVQRSQIINLSLGGPRDAVLEKLLDAAGKRGIVTVAAAGASDAPMFPASHPGVLAIASAESPNASLTAPGQEILATAPGGTFDFFSGSSMATAQATGVLALLLEHRPTLAPSALADLLEQTARVEGDSRVIDACAAVGKAVDKPQTCPTRAP